MTSVYRRPKTIENNFCSGLDGQKIVANEQLVARQSLRTHDEGSINKLTLCLRNSQTLILIVGYQWATFVHNHPRLTFHSLSPFKISRTHYTVKIRN